MGLDWDGPPDVRDAAARAMADWDRHHDGKGLAPEDPRRITRARLERLLRWNAPYREAITLVGDGTHEYARTEAIGYAEDFLAQPPGPRGVIPRNLLVLAGTTGTGKTTASLHVMERGEPALSYSWREEQHPRFRHVAELLALGVYGTEQQAERRRLAGCKVLVIDDLGVEPMSEPTAALMDWLLNARYGAPGFTVLTTNLPIDDFHARYGDRIYDRLRERADWREISHGSLRGG